MGGKEWITVVVVALGWAVVHFLSRNRDYDKLLLELRRDAAKERRESARDVLKQLRDLEEKASSFHTAAQYVSSDAETQMRLLDRLGRELRLLLPTEFPEAFSALRRAFTLMNFDEDEFETQELDSLVMKQIREKCAAVEAMLLPLCRLWEAPKSISQVRDWH